MPVNTDPVRVGLVGLGGHGRTIQAAVGQAQNLEVEAVYDVAEPEAQAAAHRFGCDVAPSYEALLSRQDLEAVVLATPNFLHRPQAEAAFAAGLHVWVEKPIANTVADGIATIEAASAARRVLMVGHNMRFSRSTQQVRRYLDEGRLGQVASVEIHFSMDTARRLASDAWRLRPDQCPLLPVMQLGIHAIDLVHYLIGQIRDVQAYARSVLTPAGVPDNVIASFRVEDGTLGTMVSNYCTQTRFEYQIAGTEGTVRCTPHHVSFRRTADTNGYGDGPTEEYDYRTHDRESYVRQMEAFGRAVRGHEPPAVDGWVGLQALAVVEALQHAIDTSAAQRVPDVPQMQVS